MEQTVDAISAFKANRIVGPDGRAIITNGFSTDPIDMDGIDYMSAQRIGKLVDSPRHYEWRYILGNRDAETPAKKKGKLTHWALLQPKEFLSRYIIPRKFTGKGARAAKKAWLESIPSNAILVTPDDAHDISNMIKALNADPLASKLLSKGTPEVRTFYADHEFKDDDGRPFLWFGIMDFLRSGNWIVEVKTTKCAKRKEFTRDLYQMGYHIQLWKYRRAVQGITGIAPKVAIVAVENVEPYCVQVFEPLPAMLEQANYEVTLALESYKECRASGTWHGYSKETVSIGHPPDWLKSRFEDGNEDG